MPAAKDGTPQSDRERPFVQYTIDPGYLGMDWAEAGFSDEDATFRLIELTPMATERAIKLGGKNQAKASTELIYAAIWQVGGWKTRNKRKDLERWYDAIGGRGRKLVEAAFMALNSVEEDDVETFLASGKPGFGG
jgi:hypothetical protein